MMKSPFQKAYRLLTKLIEWKPEVSKFKNKVSLGSRYGGWTIPANFLNTNSIVYLAGAGEDISFDVQIAEKYNCKVYILDPTPRAKIHYDLLVNGVTHNKKVFINDSKTEFYSISPENLANLKFLEIGLWDEKKELRFYAPKNPLHVSHSLVNLQKTDEYIIAEVDRLSNVMKSLGHDYIDLLKIDIEGAEYKVIESIINDDIKIKVLCVEFDEAANPVDADYLTRIKNSVSLLLNKGYKIIDASSNHNYTFALVNETGLLT